MGRDESYSYTWEDTTSLSAKSISAQVDVTTIVVTPAIDETEQPHSYRGLMAAALVFSFLIFIGAVAAVIA